MRRKIKEEDLFEEKWNIKKMFIASILVLSFLVAGAYLIINQKLNIKPKNGSGVLGTSEKVSSKVVEEVKLPSKEEINKLVEQVKKELSKITEENITASGAAIGKVIQDLEELRGGKKDAGDYFCDVVCKK